jgi:SPP1 gp7 family putative phage head morphogenesis protein
MSAITDAVRQHKENILNWEHVEMDRMSRYWWEIQEDLRLEAEKLVRRMDDLKKDGKDISPTLVRQQDRYNRLLREAAERHVEFSDYASGLIRGGTRHCVDQGIEDARTVLEEAGVSIGFDHLDIAAVEAMAGILADGSPVRDVLARRFPDNWGAAETELMRGIAKGINPREVAEKMAAKLDIALSDAARIARTEQLRAYRTATLEVYDESGVVKKYKRLAANDTNTCIACILLDGQEYPIDEPLNDHPNGRCTMVPIITGREPPKWQYGRKWFDLLNDDDQEKILGPAKFRAWKQGQFDLNVLAQIAKSRVWGDTVRVRSLRDALSSR